MAKLYYIFSEISEKEKGNKKEFREAIYQCSGENFNENADYQTGVYPMGTFLSKTIKLLAPWAEQGYSPYKWMESVSKELNCVSEKDSSFANLIQDDPFADAVFQALFIYPENIQDPEKTKRNVHQFYKMLPHYLNYIELCQEHEGKFSSIKELNSLMNQADNNSPEHFTYVIRNSNKQELSSKNEMKNFLLNANLKNSTFAPSLKECNIKKLVPSSFLLPTYDTKKTKWGELKTPLEVFHITDIIDLILASLYCIFQQKYILRKCPYCKGLFISHGKKKKYCPNITYENKSCYDKKRLKGQLEREQSGSARQEKSLRTMSAQKHGSNSEAHRIFLDDCKKWRDNIKAGIETEENYVTWLECHYVHKYKDKSKAKN
jgi:hypothetical protein